MSRFAARAVRCGAALRCVLRAVLPDDLRAVRLRAVFRAAVVFFAAFLPERVGLAALFGDATAGLPAVAGALAGAAVARLVDALGAAVIAAGELDVAGLAAAGLAAAAGFGAEDLAAAGLDAFAPAAG